MQGWTKEIQKVLKKLSTNTFRKDNVLFKETAKVARIFSIPKEKIEIINLKLFFNMANKLVSVNFNLDCGLELSKY